MLDSTYPHQALSQGRKFNRDHLQRIFDIKKINVTTLDWLNFTMGSQKSDGTHYLLDVNYFKAQHVIALADLMRKENNLFDISSTWFHPTKRKIRGS